MDKTEKEISDFKSKIKKQTFKQDVIFIIVLSTLMFGALMLAVFLT